MHSIDSIQIHRHNAYEGCLNTDDPTKHIAAFTTILVDTVPYVRDGATVEVQPIGQSHQSAVV